MRKIIAIILALSILAGCVARPAGLEQKSYTPRAGSSATVATESLIIAITRDENTLTPFTYVTGTPGRDILHLVYDTLFSFDSGGEIIPWMVKNYTVNASSRVFTMTLMDGQYWHDGVPLTAEDVRFTFEYALTQTQTRWINIASQIENIEVAGNVVTITLEQGNPDFIRTSLTDMPIVPRHIFYGVEDASAFDGPTIGSSLFRLTRYVIGQYYVFEAFEGYFRGTPTVSRINMPIMSDAAAVTQSLIAGQISAATSSIAPETFDVFRGTDGLEILSGRGFAPVMLKFNTEREILSNSSFRRALIYAIDIEAMMNTVTLGYATPGLPGFLTESAPGARTYVFDPARANAMLDELGYSHRGSDGIRLSGAEPIAFDLLVQSGNAARIRIAELISGYLEAVGIGVTVVAMESDTVSALVWPSYDVARGRDFDMAMWGWSAPMRLDPAALVRLGMSDTTFGTANVAGFADDEFDELSRAFLAQASPAVRAEISMQMQELIADLAPFINLWYADINFAVNTDHFDGWVLQTGSGAGAVNRFSFLPQE